MKAIIGILLMMLCISTVGFSQETNTYYNGEDTIEYIGEIYGIDKFTYEDSLILKELVDTFKLDFSEMEYLPSNTDQYVNFIATITNSYYHKTIGVFGEFIHFEEFVQEHPHIYRFYTIVIYNHEGMKQIYVTIF